MANDNQYIKEQLCERRLSRILKDERPHVGIPLLRCDLKLIVLLCFIALFLFKEGKTFYCSFLLFSHTSVESPSDLGSISGEWLWELFLSDGWCFSIFIFIFFPPLSAVVPFPHKCYRKLYIFPGGLARLTPPNAYQRQKNDPSVCRENLLTLHETNLISP